MDKFRGKFALKINLKRAPLEEKTCGEMLKEFIKIIEKYKILDDLNFIEIFKIEINQELVIRDKGVDA